MGNSMQWAHHCGTHTHVVHPLTECTNNHSPAVVSVSGDPTRVGGWAKLKHIDMLQFKGVPTSVPAKMTTRATCQLHRLVDKFKAWKMLGEIFKKFHSVFADANKDFSITIENSLICYQHNQAFSIERMFDNLIYPIEIKIIHGNHKLHQS